MIHVNQPKFFFIVETTWRKHVGFEAEEIWTSDLRQVAEPISHPSSRSPPLGFFQCLVMAGLIVFVSRYLLFVCSCFFSCVEL